MTTKEKVLKFLEDNRGNPVSGEYIAGMLGISRNGVWKAVKQLQSEGHTISAGTNRGYQLEHESRALSAPAIEKCLKVPCDIILKKATTSTNDDVKKLADGGAQEWTLVIAEEQTAGKGRLGRSFYSPPGTGIYMSLLLRPKFPAQLALLITTAAAAAAAKALEANGCDGAKIKWVNDVYVHERKVCGILTEGSFDFETGLLNYAVLGIGINIAMPENGFPEDIAQKAGAAFETMQAQREKIIADVINEFYSYYINLEVKPHREYYCQRSMLQDKLVTVSSNGEMAIVRGIDDDFRLVVEYADGRTEALSSGEVSVKPINAQK